MKQNHTLVFQGSPRNHGNTQYLLDRLLERMDGTVEIFSAYSVNISACIDCRYCWKNPGCSIRDDMDKIYDALTTCNQIIVASPIYFAELTGPLLSIFSRLQTYFAAHKFRHEENPLIPKNAGVILCGGGSGGYKQSLKTVDMAFRHMNAHRIGEVYSLKTDQMLASEDPMALAQIEILAKKFADLSAQERSSK